MIDEYKILNRPETLKFFEVSPYSSTLHQLDGKSYAIIDTRDINFYSVMFKPNLKITHNPCRVYNVEISLEGLDYRKIRVWDDRSRDCDEYYVVKELTFDEFNEIIIIAELSK